MEINTLREAFAHTTEQERLLALGHDRGWLTHAEIHEAAGMPILNGITNLVKLGEMAVKTNRLMSGRFTSKRCSYAPPPAEQIAEFRRHYGADIYPTVKAP